MAITPRSFLYTARSSVNTPLKAIIVFFRKISFIENRLVMEIDTFLIIYIIFLYLILKFDHVSLTSLALMQSFTIILKSQYVIFN